MDFEKRFAIQPMDDFRRESFECNDGEIISIQRGRGYRCSATTFEIYYEGKFDGFCFKSPDHVYPGVNLETVNALIAFHGGLLY